MSTLLVMVLGFFFAYAIYIATTVRRHSRDPSTFLDAGQTIPGWGYIFAATGVVVASLGLHDHFILLSTYGFQYNNVIVGLILVALSGALFQKRLWLAARIMGLRTPISVMADYYGSVALRILLLILLFLFAVPFAAEAISKLGNILEVATGGAVTRSLAIWGTAFFLFLFSVIGGWRAAVYVVAAQTFLIFALLLFTSGFGAATLDGMAILHQGLATPEGVMSDRVPGVIQFTDGMGKESAIGGPWTTTALLSFAVAMTGVVLSPAFGFLGITASTRSGFAFNQVWMTAGLAAGLLLLLGPVIGAELSSADAAGVASGRLSYEGLIAKLSAIDHLAAIGFVLIPVAASQILVSFFALSGANLVTDDLVGRFVLVNLSDRARVFSARVTLAAIYLCIVIMATFTPIAAAVLGSVALSLSAQLLPAFLGLCWLPWISRSAVLVGFVVGALIVVFTEPLGLILFEGLLLELPWGRWPLTIHSAGWGLVFNLAICLLASWVTKSGSERDHRDRLHRVFRSDHRTDFGGPGVRGAKWSLTLIWTFLALGPGVVLGNSFFSQPVFSGTTLTLGLPSIWIWQIVFWFIGVLLVWWQAYQGRLSIIDADVRGPLAGESVDNTLSRRRPPSWIALLLERLVPRS